MSNNNDNVHSYYSLQSQHIMSISMLHFRVDSVSLIILNFTKIYIKKYIFIFDRVKNNIVDAVVNACSCIVGYNKYVSQWAEQVVATCKFLVLQ